MGRARGPTSSGTDTGSFSTETQGYAHLTLSHSSPTLSFHPKLGAAALWGQAQQSPTLCSQTQPTPSLPALGLHIHSGNDFQMQNHNPPPAKDNGPSPISPLPAVAGAAHRTSTAHLCALSHALLPGDPSTQQCPPGSLDCPALSVPPPYRCTAVRTQPPLPPSKLGASDIQLRNNWCVLPSFWVTTSHWIDNGLHSLIDYISSLFNKRRTREQQLRACTSIHLPSLALADRYIRASC